MQSLPLEQIKRTIERRNPEQTEGNTTSKGSGGLNLDDNEGGSKAQTDNSIATKKRRTPKETTTTIQTQTRDRGTKQKRDPSMHSKGEDIDPHIPLPTATRKEKAGNLTNEIVKVNGGGPGYQGPTRKGRRRPTTGILSTTSLWIFPYLPQQ